jgi:phosphatidylglycerophosphate synthase
VAERPLNKLSTKRLLGFDRSGPPPVETGIDQPLRPWTVPNAIGFVRLALIPVFLVLALTSSGGVGAAHATLYAVIGWGDYADGIAARITRQYSRLGALMDPVSDRLLVLSGAIVTWRFALLPRWAIALLAARELFMLAAGRYALSRGVQLQINWPGRLAVAPVLGSFFFAMVGLEEVGEGMLYAGLALAMLATVLYVRGGVRAIWGTRGASAARPPERGA